MKDSGLVRKRENKVTVNLYYLVRMKIAPIHDQQKHQYKGLKISRDDAI